MDTSVLGSAKYLLCLFTQIRTFEEANMVVVVIAL
jgi:hypothetical protein